MQDTVSFVITEHIFSSIILCVFISLEWEAPKGNRLMQGFATIRDYPFVVMSRHANIVSHAIKGIIFILYNIYLAFAIKYMVDQKMVIKD